MGASPDIEDDGSTDFAVSLDEARTVVDKLDTDDPLWLDLQWFVADGLHERFLAIGYPALPDLDEAAQRARTVVTMQEESSAAHNLDFAIILWTQFEATGHEPFLHEQIGLLERTNRALITQGDPDELRVKCACNLATALNARSSINANADDRLRARELWEDALAGGVLDADERRGVLANLAQALSYPEATEQELLQAVSYGREAVGAAGSCSLDEESLTAESDDAQVWLSLGNALDGLQALQSGLGVLDEAIDATTHGLELLGEDHEDYPGYAANLAGLLRQRARRANRREDLVQARRIVEAAFLSASAPDHPDRLHVLITTGAVLSDLAYTDDDDELMRAALGKYRVAADSTAEGSDVDGVVSTNLTAVLREAADVLLDAALLDEAIGYGERALRAFSTQSAGRAAALTTTANVLRDRFVALGDLGDLDRAVALAREALNLTPPEHYEHPVRLTNLAVLLSDNYTERAERADLDEAIRLYREALLFPDSSEAHIAERRNDLSLALKDRHEEADTLDDLNESIELGAVAVAAVPRESLAWAGWASNYGNALAERYELTGQVTDLDTAIDLFAMAAESAQSRAVEASGYKNNLGLALAARADATGNLAELDIAILRLKEAMDLVPIGHPDASLRSSNLADIYRVRSVTKLDRGDRKGALEDARTAVDEARSAVRIAHGVVGASEARALPPLSNLARAMRWMSSLEPASVDASEILAVQHEAANLPHITPAERFSQSAQWAEDAEKMGDLEQATNAYRQAVDITTEVAWIGLSQNERLSLLALMSTVTGRAVASFIQAGHHWEAIAAADHVRSVLWRQDLLVRDVDDGSGTFLTSALVEGSDAHATSFDADNGGRTLHRREREDRRHAAHHAAANLQLSRRHASDYATMSIPGALIMLVPGDATALALVMRDGCEPLTIDLPLANSSALSERVRRLRDAVKAPIAQHGSWTPQDERRMRHRIFDVLQWLWDAVAHPIVEALDKANGIPAKVWWSPLGDFALVPIHAAGRHPRTTLHRRNSELSLGDCLADRVESSYLPIVFKNTIDDGTGNDKVLYVSAGIGQDAPTSEDAELGELSALRRSFGSKNVAELLGTNATNEAVREAIPRHRHLHVAAHGQLHDTDFLRSGIALTDGRLTLSGLAACNASHGGLAMILSCDSATGAVNSPNETLHVAGAAMAAGYQNVIAAGMPLRNSTTGPVVSSVYAALAGTAAMRRTGVAHALHAAVNAIRVSPDTCSDPLAWAPYAHFGWTDD